MNRVRTPVKVRSIPTSRAETALRVRAARLLAGGPTLKAVADEAGMSYMHLRAVERGAEPLLPSDAIDLSRVLGCPAGWLARGWEADET